MSVTPIEVKEKKAQRHKYQITPTHIAVDGKHSLPPSPKKEPSVVSVKEKRKGSVKPLKDEFISSVPIPQPLFVPPRGRGAQEERKEGVVQVEKEEKETERKGKGKEKEKEKKSQSLRKWWEKGMVIGVVERGNVMKDENGCWKE